MFLTMIGFISMFQMFPMLRSFRTLPKRLSTLTSYMVFWPIILMAVFGFIAFSLHSLSKGTAFPWQAFTIKIIGTSTIIIALPVFLRFGANFFTIFGFILLVSFSGNFSLIIGFIHKVDLLNYGTLFFIAFTILITLAWITTYRALGSTHPWRANRFNFGAMKRTH